MEFTIDFELVRKLTRREHQLASEEIATYGAVQAFRNSLQRHDAQLTGASDNSILACKQGCSWCCHFSIDVRAYEALNIVEYLRENFSPDQINAIRSNLVTNSQLLSNMDDEQRMRVNIPCAFLRDNSCSIYPARPQTCRNYHATDAAGCKQSYEQPDNMDIAPEFTPVTFQTGASQVDAFAKAVQEAGYETDVYEFNTALLDTLDRPDEVLQRFNAKQSPFNTDGNAIPLEFMDMEE